MVRQVQESGILWNATQLRQLIAEDDCYSLPKIKITGFPDIKLVPGTELIEELTNCYDHDGTASGIPEAVPYRPSSRS